MPYFQDYKFVFIEDFLWYQQHKSSILKFWYIKNNNFLCMQQVFLENQTDST